MLKDAGSGRPNDTGAYRKSVTGPTAHQGAVYVVAGSAGSVHGRTGYHPAMFFDKLAPGSLVIDIDGQRLEAKFLRETGAIDDSFTILKGAAPEPLRLCTFAVRNGEAVVRWKSEPGHAYRIEHTPSLQNATWTPASAQIVATGATTSWTSPVPAGESQHFYRVLRLSP